MLMRRARALFQQIMGNLMSQLNQCENIFHNYTRHRLSSASDVVVIVVVVVVVVARRAVRVVPGCNQRISRLVRRRVNRLIVVIIPVCSITPVGK